MCAKKKKKSTACCGRLARAQRHQFERVGLEGGASAALLPKAFKRGGEGQATMPSQDSLAAGGATGQSVTPKAGARVQEPRIRAIARSRVWVGDGDGRERKKEEPLSSCVTLSESSCHLQGKFHATDTHEEPMCTECKIKDLDYN